MSNNFTLYRITIRILTIFMISIFAAQTSYSKSINLFKKIDIPNSIQTQSKFLKDDEVSYFKIDKIALNQIIYEKPDNLKFNLLVSNNIIWQIELSRYEILTPSAIVSAATENGEKAIDVHQEIANYRGTVINEKGLLVNITFSPTDVNAIIFSDTQTWIIGNNDNSDTYVFYNQENISEKPAFSCSHDENKISNKVQEIMYHLKDKQSLSNNTILNSKQLNVEIAVILSS
jgi:hypothetical protein